MRGGPTGTLVDLLAGTVAGGEPGRPGIVHRLDRDTSGLMVVARSEEAHRRLSSLVRKRELERTYTALVRGVPASRTGQDRGADRPRPRRPDPLLARHRHAARGDHALRADRAAAARTRSSRVRLETGRTHQIRVHLAAIDLPVVGDPVYGVPEPRLGRQFLHASRLAFPHPFTGERIDVDSPLPPDLAEYLATLG